MVGWSTAPSKAVGGAVGALPIATRTLPADSHVNIPGWSQQSAVCCRYTTDLLRCTGRVCCQSHRFRGSTLACRFMNARHPGPARRPGAGQPALLLAMDHPRRRLCYSMAAVLLLLHHPKHFSSPKPTACRALLQHSWNQLPNLVHPMRFAFCVSVCASRVAATSMLM